MNELTRKAFTGAFTHHFVAGVTVSYSGLLFFHIGESAGTVAYVVFPISLLFIARKDHFG